MKNRIGRALDRRLSGVECTRSMQSDILRRIAREEGKDKVKMRRKMPTALIAALIGALLLAGLAYAASQSKLLQWMYQDRQPSESAVQLVKTEELSVEESGVRFTLKESLFDAQRLILIYSIENTTGQTVLLDTERLEGTVTVGGERVQSSNNEGNSLQAVGGEIGGKQMPNPYEQIITYDLLKDTEGQPVQVEVTAYVYKPLAALSVDNAQFMGPDDWSLLPPETGLILSSGGRALLGSYQAIHDAHVQNNHAVWDGSDDTDRYYDGDALVDAKYAEPLCELKLSFTLTPDPEKQSKGTKVKGSDTFELNDFTLVVKDMDFRTAGGHIFIEIWPKQQPIPEGDETEDHPMFTHPLNRWSEFFDENGEKLQCGFAGSGGFYTDENGRSCFTYDWKTGPLTQIPSKVTIVPMDKYNQALVRQPGLTEEQYWDDPTLFNNWDDAVTVELEPKG